jgi:hypothetical protein
MGKSLFKDVFLCKAISTERLCWNCSEKQAWYGAKQLKEGTLAGVEHSASF